MNKLYHFGDSYATLGAIPIHKHFCGIIADELGYEYRAYGMSGLSNEQILNKIIKLLLEFEKDDIIFINFSFFQRGCWYDKSDNKIKSTNKFYDETAMKKTNYSIGDKEKILLLLNYYIEHSEDYARKIFKLFNSTLKILEKKGVKIFYIFIEETEYSDELLNVGTNIKFYEGFSKWLIKNQFHLGQDIHYTAGIQPMLADVILRKTEYLKLDNNIINISITDIDYKKIYKAEKLL